MVTVLGMATIIFMMTNDHSRDGGHHWGRLEDFDHFGEGHLPGDGDHPKNSDHHRGGNHPKNSGCLRDFCHPKGWLLDIGSIESQVSNKNQFEQSVTLSVCL